MLKMQFVMSQLFDNKHGMSGNEEEMSNFFTKLLQNWQKCGEVQI